MMEKTREKSTRTIEEKSSKLEKKFEILRSEESTINNHTQNDLLSSSKSTSLSSSPSKFESMRAKFDEEMRKMEEDMNKFRSQLTERERELRGEMPTSKQRSSPTNMQQQQHQQQQRTTSSSSSSTKIDHNNQDRSSWIDDLDSPLIKDTPDGGKLLKLKFDVTQYEPEEIVVKTIDNKLHVHAKHEEKSEHRSVYREYNREFLLPDGVNLDQIRSTLSRDGVLIVEAPLPRSTPSLRDHRITIPIKRS